LTLLEPRLCRDGLGNRNLSAHLAEHFALRDKPVVIGSTFDTPAGIPQLVCAFSDATL